MSFNQMGYLTPITYLPPIYNFTTYLLTNAPTYLHAYYLTTHPPISYNLLTFVPHSFVMMC